MKQDEFIALTTRLRRAADVLRKEGCLLQAIARRYYLVYAYAVQAAEKHGIAFRRGSTVDKTRRPTHQVLPTVVEALYTGRNVGSVLGGGPRRHTEWAIDRWRSSLL
jgi:phage terminase small subunit